MSAPATAAPRSWRTHPLGRRLPLLVLAALGFALWKWTSPPERTLTLQLEGAGWARVAGLELQVVDPAGEVRVRQENRFAHGAPPELTLKLDLPDGDYRLRAFPYDARAQALPALTRPLSLGTDRAPVVRLLPPAVGSR